VISTALTALAGNIGVTSAIFAIPVLPLAAAALASFIPDARRPREVPVESAGPSWAPGGSGE
jgi:hypothetical protein